MTATLEPISAFAGVNPALTSATASVATKLKVWLVDDNDRLRTLISELLGLEADIECARQFSSPDQLLSTLASRPGPDVILLDVQMGDRNGLDVVRPIKSLTPTTRVFMFTSCFNPEWRARALSEGASDYLLKTDALKKVAARIRCPATDANPLTQLRRAVKRPVAQAVVHQAITSPLGKASKFLSHPFSRLRAWWN